MVNADHRLNTQGAIGLRRRQRAAADSRVVSALRRNPCPCRAGTLTKHIRIARIFRAIQGDGRWQPEQSWLMWQSVFWKLWRVLGTPSSESLSLRHNRINELRAARLASRAMIFLKSLSPCFPRRLLAMTTGTAAPFDDPAGTSASTWYSPTEPGGQAGAQHSGWRAADG